MVNITTDRLSTILVLHSLGPQVLRSRLRTDTEKVKLNKDPIDYNGSQIVQKHGLRPQANNVSYSTVGMRRKETVGPGDGHAELMRLRRRSAHWRHVNVKLPSMDSCNAGATPQHPTSIDQWSSCDGGQSFHLCCTKVGRSIGKGWPSRVARERVPIQWYEVVIVPWATGCPASPLPI